MMGKFAIASATVLALSAITLPLHASDKVDSTKICETLASMGHGIMTERQKGRPMTQITKKYTELWVGKGLSPDVEKVLQKYSKQLIMQAYEQPRFSTASYQKEQVTEFENSIFLSCLKSQ
ncbi:hypothetical protein [Roseovarius tolerans]|nr:hypothetical protein [Roseovarius tolerans]